MVGYFFSGETLVSIGIYSFTVKYGQLGNMPSILWIAGYALCAKISETTLPHKLV
jgi:hypothetical protein